MFIPKTEKIKDIAGNTDKTVIFQLESLLQGSVGIYIDYANVKPWSQYLGWHIDLKRLKQFLDSFDNIKTIKIYVGTLFGDRVSEKAISEIKNLNYDLRTKKVKIMKFSIDASSVSEQSTDLLKQFIRNCLIRRYEVSTIEYLNSKFAEMNSRGERFLEDRKCNFDVEIGRDMLVDHEKGGVDTYVLWSGDSDFAEPLENLLDSGKKAVLFATSRKVSKELGNLREKGLFIFDIRKIKDFICWRREL